ncbi:MAG: UDP-3-O-(3-hydroxymyristoyl)glucosamine N-acyltransferase [Rickettsiales bacterium]|jgi:UDP-3-O-[3-hydroxymyristoyl] glucosamine N-acyltransferase|nr:UDP-3-O-(3-hydroxymyristoyl)glucosamine N-acyltransferase [Rickettsiales bacterium]
MMKRLLIKLFGPRVHKATAGELAKKFGLDLRGDPKTPILGIAPIADAKPGDASFYSTERNSEAFKILPIETLEKTRASVILLQPENAGKAPAGAALLISDHPRADVVKMLDYLYAEKPRRGISLDAIVARRVFFRRKKSVYIAPFAVIERGAAIEENVQIHTGAYIGRNVRIGKNTIVHSNAVIENATIGDDCVIHNGASIGKDGFGYTRQDGHNIFIPHAGRVIIGNRVSVGANSCVDRGALTDTQIGDGTKIDNLVQIAHGVIMGRECFAAAGTGITGGCVIGDRVMLGGQVGVANGNKIGDDAEIGAQSGVISDIPANAKIFGTPAMPYMDSLRMTAWVKKNALAKK